eukprot:scaffold18839_cov61-Cyclotella_meneghiniana.AAC.9
MTKAKEKLEKIDCVGVLENLPDLVLQLKTWLDFMPAHTWVFNFSISMQCKSTGRVAHPKRQYKNSRYTSKTKSNYTIIPTVKTAQAKACI